MASPHFDKKEYRDLPIFRNEEKLQFLAYQLGQRADGFLVALVIGPLPDAPDFHQARSLQRRQVVGHRRLRQPHPFLNAAHAHPHRVNVAFILWREVLRGILQALENLKRVRFESALNTSIKSMAR